MSARLELALHAYPQDVRAEERDVLLGLALDMIEGGSPVNREAIALGLDGLRMRFSRRRIGAAPWRDGLRLAGLPLAALFLALAVTGCLGMMREPAWIGWWWAIAIGGAALAVVGLAAGLRRTATIGSLLVLAIAVLDLRNGSRETVSVYVMHRTGPKEYDFSGAGSIDFTALGACGLGALILLAAALTVDGRRTRAVRNISWTLLAGATGVLAAALLARGFWPFDDPSGPPRDGLNLSPAAVVLALAAAGAVMALTVSRTRQHRLAATLGVLALGPVLVLAVQASLPARDTIVLGPLYLLTLTAVAVGGTRALIHSTARASG